ncbi:hypothetical protein GE09DRAFT_580867 [Coniochaeta sp. 2T2.1]|nr:hypothetical protein GE09DRAFT_580867 [Coniochaeta sp. 2T2.1]
MHQNLRNGSPTYDPIKAFLLADTLYIFHVDDPTIKDWFRYRTNAKRRGAKRGRSASPETRANLPNERSRSPWRSPSGFSASRTAYLHRTGDDLVSPDPSNSIEPSVSTSPITAEPNDSISDMAFSTPRSAIKHDAGCMMPVGTLQPLNRHPHTNSAPSLQHNPMSPAKTPVRLPFCQCCRTSWATTSFPTSPRAQTDRTSSTRRSRLIPTPTRQSRI